MAWLFLVAASFPAFALPDRAATLEESSTAVKDITVSANDSWVAWTTTAGELQLLDTSTWTVTNVTIDAGASASGGIAIGGTDDAPMLFAGLSDNSVGQWALKQGEGAVFMDVHAVEGTPLALAADANSLYAILDTEDQGPIATAYDVQSFVAKYSEVADLANDGFVDMDARYGAADTEDGAAIVTYLYVAHGAAKLSRVSAETGTASSGTENEGNLTIQDVWTEDGGTTTWFANSGSTGSTAYVTGDESEIDIIAPSSPSVGSGLGIGGSAADGWIGVSEASSLHIFTYSGGTAIGEEQTSIDDAAGATEIAAITGYGFAGTSAGTWVITDRPWVEIVTISATDVAPDEAFTLTFTSDIAGKYQVNYQVAGAGAEPEDVAGASGDVEADVETSATVTLPSTGADVTYLVEVQVTPSGSVGYGRDGEYVGVNEPAPAPTIDASTVSFGDESVRVTFEAFDLDIAQSYVVYLTTEEFASDDYATGGPSYVGPDKDPGELTAEPDEYGVFDCYIGGLTNGTTYYVAARAIDADDGIYSESPMSDVYAATPEETYSLSERLGIEGFCGLPLESAGWFGSFAAAIVGLRRRGSARRVPGKPAAGSVAGVAALVLLALPGTAHAKPHEDDLTSRHWDFEVRYGAFLSQDNQELKDAFGSSDNKLLRADLGWASNLLEVDLGFGLYSDDGGQTTSSGDASSDSDKLTVVPLAADATFRLDLWKEQPVVPFARVGVDYWIWNETWTSPYDASGGGETTDGTFGWHWGAGLYLLLDSLDEGSASRLETIAGVNDTYIVAEYRQTYSLGSGTLDFTSTDVTVGLKFDY